MARQRSALPVEANQQILAYLRRAFDRNAPIFDTLPGPARESFGHLLAAVREQKAAAASGLINTWLEKHLSEEGRKKLLAVLRRRRADTTGSKRSKFIRVPAAAFAVFDELAGKLGTSVPLALHAAAEVVLVSADNRSKAKKLALAMKLKTPRSPTPASKSENPDAPSNEDEVA